MRWIILAALLVTGCGNHGDYRVITCDCDGREYEAHCERSRHRGARDCRLRGGGWFSAGRECTCSSRVVKRGGE